MRRKIIFYFPEPKNEASGVNLNISEAFNLIPDNAKDIDFLALALKINGAVLSKDRGLKKQSKVQIFDETSIHHLLKI